MKLEILFQFIVPLTFLAIWALTSAAAIATPSPSARPLRPDAPGPVPAGSRLDPQAPQRQEQEQPTTAPERREGTRRFLHGLPRSPARRTSPSSSLEGAARAPEAMVCRIGQPSIEQSRRNSTMRACTSRKTKSSSSIPVPTGAARIDCWLRSTAASPPPHGKLSDRRRIARGTGREVVRKTMFGRARWSLKPTGLSPIKSVDRCLSSEINRWKSAPACAVARQSLSSSMQQSDDSRGSPPRTVDDRSRSQRPECAGNACRSPEVAKSPLLTELLQPPRAFVAVVEGFDSGVWSRRCGCNSSPSRASSRLIRFQGV